MNKKLPWLLTLLFLAIGTFAEAQQAGKVPRIGFLVRGSQTAYSTHIEAFREGLRDRGYIEGKNIVVSTDTRKQFRPTCCRTGPPEI